MKASWASRRSREAFFAAFGFGPYECFFCHKPMEFADQLHVHHINEDKSCDHPYNLTAIHPGCHLAWHNSSPERIRKSAESRRGRKQTPEHIAKRVAYLYGNDYGKGNKGRKVTPEHRANISAALLRYHEEKRA